MTPTHKESQYHELIVDSGKFEIVQEETDIRRLAICAQNTDDQDTKDVVLLRWNKLHPKDQYQSFYLFFGVEVADDDLN